MSKPKALIAGGLGYIGSHTCIELYDSGYELVVVDNLCNSNISVLHNLKLLIDPNCINFYQIDLTNSIDLQNIFKEHKIDVVIHFAALKAVNESIDKPILYYKNNMISTLNLLEIMQMYDCNKMIFSSSATVYGDSSPPLIETSSSRDLDRLTNPYAQTKAMIEQILQDTCRSNPKLSIVALRYFNPIGGHSSGLFGDNPSNVPSNLMPYIMRVAKYSKESLDSKSNTYKELTIFGNDYPTLDGTAVRDYVHVCDLAKGHIAAINGDIGFHVYNLGTGKGTTVLELVQAFERANGVKVPFKYGSRRSGDVPISVCDTGLAELKLNWTAKLSIEDMCRSSWRFINKALV